MKLQQLRKLEDGDLEVSLGLYLALCALGQGGLLGGNLRCAYLTGVKPFLYLLQQLCVVLALLPRHLKELLVVKDLDVCLRYCNPYVVAGLFELGRGRFEVKLADFDSVVDVETLEDGNIATKAERGGSGVGVGVGVVGSQTAAERQVLRGSTAQ